MRTRPPKVLLGTVALLVAVTALNAAPALGPLRVHPKNPRYFTDGTTNADGSLRGIYLGGHQIFVDLQDNSFNKEWTKDLSNPDDPKAQARRLDWDRYLEFVERQHFNYLRNWIIWSTGSGTAAAPHRIASPTPFARTGPGTARDGGPKFDLRRFDESFFQRLRSRARDLQNRGVYLSVMLFELYGFLDGEEVNGQRLWEGNLFNGANNINGVEVDRNGNRLGEEFFSLEDAAVLSIQKAYVEKMVDVLNDLDNVLWEICNEAPAAALAWQLEMLRHLKAYEARQPKQHLVLLSPGGWLPGGWRLAPEEGFTQSPADFIATASGWINKADPKVYRIGKPVVLDLDHVGPGDHEPSLIWKAYTRGYHFSLYDQPFEQPQHEAPAWQLVRANLRQTCRLSVRVRDLARMEPRPDLASTGFCLANPGEDYVIFAPRQEEIRVHGLQVGANYAGEWFDIATAAREAIARTFSGSPTLGFRAPCAGAVLFLTLESQQTRRPGP
jgi:hypothetical protein